MIGLGGGPAGRVCSRAGCGAAAAWCINWRNPRIHPESRVKIWLACDDHRDWLRDYLAARAFPVVVTPIDEPLERLPEETPA
ncbi:hypothetical protein QF206_04110 [Klugiella sp. YN-L-19]|uniref:Acetone carboxylase n=1 Tax=Ruicaihuangia caeni TaxID=3042517 RepID=A0AAW6T743_9MICO|nr:hypothetical protein [Klugiella sp. YN-L-19]MDI2098149.1 hypothetical protein [Klugiella sp. YN-L-19]